MTNDKTVTISRELAENLLHCGDTASTITPFVTARLRELLSAQAAGLDERTEFEKWLRNQPHVVNLGFNRTTGKYVLQEDEDSWQAWQARALLAAPVVERQPYAWEIRYKDGDDHQGFVQTEERASYYRGMAYHVIPLYASPPAPVAVVLPELTDEQRDVEVTEMAEFMGHLSGGLRHFAGYLIDAGWRKQNACLDKVKEMNQ